MDEQAKKDFDAQHATIVKLRNESEVAEKFDAFMSSYGELILEGVDAGASFAAPFVPGGPAGLIVEHLVAEAAKAGLRRYLANRAAPAS
jgi:hypothetical protein